MAGVEKNLATFLTKIGANSNQTFSATNQNKWKKTVFKGYV